MNWLSSAPMHALLAVGMMAFGAQDVANGNALTALIDGANATLFVLRMQERQERQ